MFIKSLNFFFPTFFFRIQSHVFPVIWFCFKLTNFEFDISFFCSLTLSLQLKDAFQFER